MYKLTFSCDDDFPPKKIQSRLRHNLSLEKISLFSHPDKNDDDDNSIANLF